MGSRDQAPEDRAALLLGQITPDLLSLLKNAPEYGSCGIDIHITQGQITRTSIRAEITRELKPRTIRAQGGKCER
jgi:hypothetical protein